LQHNLGQEATGGKQDSKKIIVWWQVGFSSWSVLMSWLEKQSLEIRDLKESPGWCV
jgi:hypothetical protein